jgi:diguanylate cyclase (GGDEF)-like protein
VTDGVPSRGRATDWVAETARTFGDALATAVSDGEVADRATAEASRLLGATTARLLDADEPLPDDAPGLSWRATAEAGPRRLAVAVGSDTLWTARHDAALAAMGPMLHVAMRVQAVQTVERELRSAQAGAQASVLRKLEHRQRVLDEMVRVQRSLARRAPFQQKLDLVTAAVAQVLGVDMVAVRLVDPLAPDELVVVSGAGLAPGVPARSPVIGSGVGGAAFRSNRTITVDDYRGHPSAMATYQVGGVRAAMASPVQQFGRAVGSIVAATTTPGRRFDQADRETLQAFADQASIALTEQHLYTEMQQGLVDPLTGLANRAQLHDQLANALELGTGDGAGPAILFIDLDGFKLVNDAMGHGAGDELLVKVAQRLREVVQAPSLVARFGGDEFTVLLPSVKDLGAASDCARSVLDSLQPLFEVAGHEVSVSASIGIAWDRRRPGSAAQTAVDMLRCADTAMYRAKAAGRGQFAVFEERMHEELVRALARERHLRSAVELDELTAHFQPVVDIVSGEVVGAEALVRWERDGHLVPPSKFIELAEETGLIVPLGRTVLRRACRALAAWEQEGRTGLTMSVNLSVRELESPTLVPDVRAAIEELGVTPANLVLELTESALMRDVAVMTGRLTALRDLGVKIAIDDFGTGYSSLARLRWLPIDILKIDRSFIELVDVDRQSAAMLRAVVALAAALDLEVVVEGVERASQVEVITALGLRHAQGFLYSAAVPADQLTALLDGPLVQRAPARVPQQLTATLG